MTKLFSQCLWVILTVITTTIYAQPFNAWSWAHGAGGPIHVNARAVTNDPSGNVIFTGMIYDSVDFDPGPGTAIVYAPSVNAYVCCYSKTGNFMWAGCITGTNQIDSYGIGTDANGNVYVSGTFTGTADFNPDTAYVASLTSYGQSDIFVLKLDNNGQFIWVRHIGGPYSEENRGGLDIDPSGNVVILGNFGGTVDFDPDPFVYYPMTATGNEPFILKLNGIGDFEMAFNLSCILSSYGFSVTTDIQGNIIVTGTFRGTMDFDPDTLATYALTSAGSEDIFLAKYTSSGLFLWANAMGGNQPPDQGRAVACDGAGNIYVTGLYRDTADFDPTPATNHTLISSNGTEDIFILSCDPVGSVNWVKSIGGTGGDAGYGITCGQGNSIYLTGIFTGTVDFDPSASGTHMETSSGNWDTYLLQMQTNGTFAEVHKAGGTGVEIGYGISTDMGDNIYIVGLFESPAMQFDTLTILNNPGIIQPSADFFVARYQDLTTGLREDVKIREVEIYPNPVSDAFSILFPERINQGSVHIYDITGKIILELNFSDQKQLRINSIGWKQGIYEVCVESGLRQWSSKFMKIDHD